MSKLLNSLQSIENKQPYQTYTLEHGIERLTVLVPVKNVPVFEQQFAALSVKSKPSILQLVESAGGKVKN